eukprot:TRINITY_DN10706_c0_g1_i1.p1 TRINITY_DN10706_c0_g1~~TRINITY_DN10706_c0_g1_i1.p1  ORF type:complete len:206 (-),score=55.00 TRINITY_DN10706_c0_g1_i1:34-651(-)
MLKEMVNKNMRQHKNLKPELLYTESEISQRLDELALQISNDYEGEQVVVVGILRGAYFLTSELVKRTDPEKVDVKVDFMVASSYGDETETSGNVRILMDLQESIEGKHVLIVEDLVDTGLTLRSLLDLLSTRNPASLKVLVLLQKPDECRKAVIPIDYFGFQLEKPDFVVGYGMDYQGSYRQLPYVGVMREEVYKEGIDFFGNHQ